jgi:hypothetical protein
MGKGWISADTLTDAIKAMSISQILHPTSGNVFWVGNSIGSDGAYFDDAVGYGLSPTKPFATIDYAVGACTANHGDVILVLPGHHENITTAGAVTLDVAGVAVVGLGQADTRPVLHYTGTAATTLVTAADCRISNIVFQAGIASITTGISVTAANFELDHCRFSYSATTFSFITMVLTSAAATYLHVHDNNFSAEVASATSARAITMVGLLKPRIVSNYFSGTFSSAAIFGVTTLSSQCDIGFNWIYNTVTTTYGAIDGGAVNSTGNVHGNVITGLYATTLYKQMRKCNWSFGADNQMVNAVAEQCPTGRIFTSST